MEKVRVGLRPIVTGINLPTVIKTTVLPGDSTESLFVATQVGEIFFIRNRVKELFLDIRQRIIELGISNGGYDERGLLGLAFHPNFYYNGLFYLHYSVAGTQGPGALPDSAAVKQQQQGLPEFFTPDPCNSATLNLEWVNRDVNYDHIDTVEEWSLQPSGHPRKRRTLLNLRRPFFNHNGVNSLNFSPETGRLVLTTGDGGSGFDPFNLAQDDIEIAGKIIEIDVSKETFIHNHPVVSRFYELPVPVQRTLTVIAKGVRNITGISYRRVYDKYIKYIGNVGQHLVESIFSFVNYKPIPVTHLVQAYLMKHELDPEGFINFGWRAWEGALPATILRACADNNNHDLDHDLNKKVTAYYNEVVKTSTRRLEPIVSYFHEDPRPDKFAGIALTGVQPYVGNSIPALKGSIVFTDISRNYEAEPPARGVLAYSKIRTNCKLNDFTVIETNYNFGSQSAYFVSLGANPHHTRLFLGVYRSMNVLDFHQGTIFEIVP